jgi:nucleoside-diphosphate-sugar epimerase
MSGKPTVVVFGGTGHFGARICRRLAHDPDLELVVTSRNVERAQVLAAELRDDPADVRAAAIDQDASNLADRLRELNPAVVIHTAGPYQGQDYRRCAERGRRAGLGCEHLAGCVKRRR